jgi:hypothetical protein
MLEMGLLAAVIVLAAGTRWYHIRDLPGESLTTPLRVQDDPGEDFAKLVERLNQGGGFANGSDKSRADVAPLYPWLVARLGGANTEVGTLYQRARWAQCLLGAATAGLIFLFARHAFLSLPAGVLAGVLAAVYPFWIVAAGEIQDGVLAAFFVVLALYLATGSRFESFGASWLYGLSLAAVALTRAALLPFALVSLLWFLRSCRRDTGRGVPALLAVVGFVSGMAPWMIRNYETFHDVFPVVDSAYYHLWLGNRPGATGGAAATVRDDQALTERERAQEIWSTVSSDLGATLHRRIWAALSFVCGEDFLTRQRFSVYEKVEELPEESAERWRWWLAASWVFLFAFGALGWRWSFASGSAVAPAAVAVVMIPLPYILGHAEALSGPRLPLDGVLICLAAYAVVWLLAGAGDSRPKQE